MIPPELSHMNVTLAYLKILKLDNITVLLSGNNHRTFTICLSYRNTRAHV